MKKESGIIPEELFRELTAEIAAFRVNLTRKVYHRKELQNDLQALLKAFRRVNADFDIEPRKTDKHAGKKAPGKKQEKEYDIPKFNEDELMHDIDHAIEEARI